MPSIDKLDYIRYRFRFRSRSDQVEVEEPVECNFTVFLEKDTHDLVQPVREEEPIPEWAKLNFAKCGSCPLADKDYKYCPTARSLVDVVEFFADLPSYEEVEVIVETPKRIISAQTTVQLGLRSLMGLLMPISGCPILMKLKPMTFTHLPFSSIEETTYRAVSMYLLNQYFSHRFGGEASFDLEGLRQIYKELHDVNLDFLQRLRSASRTDANLNSLVSLDVFTIAIPRSIDNQLEKLMPLFMPDTAVDDDSESCR